MSKTTSMLLKDARSPWLHTFREIIMYSAAAVFVLEAFRMYGGMNDLWNRPWGGWTVIYYIKTFIEVTASGFVIFYFLVAAHYRKPTDSQMPICTAKDYSNIVVIYLCCDDVDQRALESILTNCAQHNFQVWVHDDSTTEQTRSEVDEIVKQLRRKHARNIRIVRRASRAGGKPGAINNVISHLPNDLEYIVLCDNDSFFLSANFMETALPYFDDPRVALVQFRNVGFTFPDDSPGYKILSSSIDFYDAFVSFMDQFGWSPFLGHNAVLRISTIKEVGGFTPGQLADDIDFSIKLRLHGYQIRYVREMACGERHPLTYEALRLRTWKWTYGCTQVLTRWGKKVLLSRKLSFLDKVTFFLTVGYYHLQILLLGYLSIFYVLLPFEDPYMGGVLNLMFSAGLILLLTFLPSITYFIQENRFLHWPKVATYWGLTYGSQDFVMLAATLRCFSHDRVNWIPTNRNTVRLKPVHFLPELSFGALIVSVAVLKHPSLLFLPTTVLFAGKFLLSPLLNSLMFLNNSSRNSVPLKRSIVGG